MDTPHFDVKLRRAQRIAILDLHGEIDGFAKKAMTAAHAEAETADPAFIVLNFEQVRYINSTGIALIVSLLTQARAAHRRIIAYGLSDHYVEIFEITRLSDFVSIVADEEIAMEEAGQRTKGASDAARAGTHERP
jgi:anti-sigma B factor antagonist